MFNKLECHLQSNLSVICEVLTLRDRIRRALGR